MSLDVFTLSPSYDHSNVNGPLIPVILNIWEMALTKGIKHILG